LIGKRSAYPGACSGKFAIPFGWFCIFGLGNVPLGKINFLSNEDTQELAPGFFIGRAGLLMSFHALLF
jgi:hypothetical protein